MDETPPPPAPTPPSDDAAAAAAPAAAPATEPTAAQLAAERMAEFQRSLAALTPRPLVTPALIAINVAVFGLMLARGVHPLTPTVASLIEWGANYGPRTTGGEPWRLLSSMFVHIGVIHILLNMFVLWDIGRFVERWIGSASFLALYLSAGVAGSLASVTYNHYSVSAGASGAVFGCYGAFVALLVRHRAAIPPEALKGLQKGAVAFLAYNLVFGFTVKGIDMAAHVGGLFGGFLAGLLVAHAPTVAGTAGRLRRAALLFAVGAAASAAAVTALPKVVDFEAEMVAFGEMERKAVETYNGAIKKSQAGELSDVALADVIDKEVLPPWRATRERLRGIQGLPRDAARMTELLERYMAAREEGWAMFAAAARTSDTTRAAAANAKQAEAVKALEELNAFSASLEKK